jgi:hypothetical protein
MSRKSTRGGNKSRRKFIKKSMSSFPRRLNNLWSTDTSKSFLTVPAFLIGFPVFDRGQAARYVARQFVLGGFEARLISDYDLYISWNVPKKKKQKVEQEGSEADFPNLMNLKKIANKYRRSA